MTDIRFVDTTIRDGHQSLWAERMTTGMMTPVARQIDAAGFEAVEILSGSHVKKCVRELRENPWDRVREVAVRLPNTPLRMIAGRINTFGFDPPELYDLFCDRMAANGVREARISDPWNEFKGWKRHVDSAVRLGMRPIINLIFSVSPRHTDAYYVERTRLALTLKPFRLCLKDPGGLLSPDRTFAIAKAMREVAGDTPIELHSHCNTGLGPLNALAAVKAGIAIVNTAIPPLADGSSLPSIFNVAHNLRALGHNPCIDVEALQPVSRHFQIIAKREGFPVGAPAEYDETQYQHQVPGGMISNLGHQLRQVGLEARLQQALEETIQVRADLGYPIMVTPLSQFVGSQAAINVIVGERYKEITDQVIHMALGNYGEEAVTLMDQNVRDRILDRPRARAIIADDAAPPTLKETRAELGGPGMSDEELLLRWLVSPKEVDIMKKTPPKGEYNTGRHPLVAVVANLASNADSALVEIRRPGFAVRLERARR